MVLVKAYYSLFIILICCLGVKIMFSHNHKQFNIHNKLCMLMLLQVDKWITSWTIWPETFLNTCFKLENTWFESRMKSSRQSGDLLSNMCNLKANYRTCPIYGTYWKLRHLDKNMSLAFIYKFAYLCQIANITF